MFLIIAFPLLVSSFVPLLHCIKQDTVLQLHFILHHVILTSYMKQSSYAGITDCRTWLLPHGGAFFIQIRISPLLLTQCPIIHRGAAMPIVEVFAPGEDLTYPIRIGQGLLFSGSGYLPMLLNRKAAVITDDHVCALYAEKLSALLRSAGAEPIVLTLPAGETSKSMLHLSSVYDFLLLHGITRSDFVVALGGGVIGDLAGYAAATWMRGVRFLQIPTTLLAQVDSSVGGKVAVNHAGGKNLLGAFYQPEQVLIDTDTLQTLDRRQLGAGLGEVIKYGCIADPGLFGILERANGWDALRPLLPDIVARCCSIKAGFVRMDPRDHGVRMALNFGHTLAHALENLEGYGTLLHGEAVCIGMAAAARWGETLGITPAGTRERIVKLLRAYSLPYLLPSELTEEDLAQAMSRDKKAEGAVINTVLLPEIGSFCTRPLPPQYLAEMLFGDPV